MMYPRKEVDILSNQLSSDSGNDSNKKKKRCQKSCSNRVILQGSQKLMIAFCKADWEYKAGTAKDKAALPTGKLFTASDIPLNHYNTSEINSE